LQVQGLTKNKTPPNTKANTGHLGAGNPKGRGGNDNLAKGNEAAEEAQAGMPPR